MTERDIKQAIQEAIDQSIKVEFDDKDKIKNLDAIKDKKVWFLITKDEKTCLQVASSKHIDKEIERNRAYLGKKDKKAVAGDNPITARNGKYSYPKGIGNKLPYLYKQMADDYGSNLIFYVLKDVDAYLGLTDVSNLLPPETKELITSMVDGVKAYYAEGKLAVQLGAVYWDCYRSGQDRCAFDYFQESAGKS